MGVITGVHNDTADSRANSHPSFAARFTNVDILMVQIANLTNRRLAVHWDHPNFAGGQSHPVSYTHLDVYKRQTLIIPLI